MNYFDQFVFYMMLHFKAKSNLNSLISYCAGRRQQLLITYFHHWQLGLHRIDWNMIGNANFVSSWHQTDRRMDHLTDYSP
ncbi:TPA: hypothetical protein I3783_000234 [Enterobacter cloacae]|nr:hypothetical protein [Enterobacter cloacae]